VTTTTSRVDRLLGAYPLLLAYVALLILYAWQTTKHSAPWLFTDELQWAELSRGVAHHGVPQLRGQGQSFSSLYEYLIAPAWWAATTPSGYAAAKYINAIVMTASLFPAYALARLFVPRWGAIAAGVATAAIPAVAYSSLLIPEPLAYTWACLVLWLVARALLRPTRRTVAVAALSLVLAPAVRSELTVLIVAALVAAAIMAGTSKRGRGVIGGWSWRERLGAVVLLVGGAIFLGAFGNHHSYSWEVGSHFHDRMFTYGLWAIGAFTIGVGILPVVIALAWLLGNPFRLQPDRALGGVLIGAVFAFGFYTAVKASYISTNFAIRVEERDLIYIAPVVFAVLARWVYAGRFRLVPLVLSAAAVWYLLHTTPLHNTEHFYSDAPGLSVLQWLNQKVYFTTTDAHRLLYGILIGSVAVVVLRELARRRSVAQRVVLAGGAALAVLVIGWNLGGEIAAANASNTMSAAFLSVLPKPPDWIDRTNGNQRTMFIGQSLSGSNEFWSLEFWNQSLQDIWSVDASAPQPGPSVTPNYFDTTGKVDPQLPDRWIVAAPGVDPVGELKTTAGGLRLYHVHYPIRIADAYGGLSTDGANWMQQSSWYYRFTSAGTKPGYAIVTLSRAAACGNFRPSHITIKLSSLKVTPEPDAQPVADKLLAVRHVTLRSTPCETKTIKIPVRTPYRLDLSAVGTFQPSQYDLRNLSAQVNFGFEPKTS
jgi:hypothetical protein